MDLLKPEDGRITVLVAVAERRTLHSVELRKDLLSGYLPVIQ